jgi:acyl carrier protein
MTAEKQQMIAFTSGLIHQQGITLDENTPLVSSGLISSLMLADLVLKIEELTHLRLPAGKVQPKDFDTIAKMLATAHRVGKPRGSPL